MSRAIGQPNNLPVRLSFGQASRLAGVPKAYLRELAESGRLAVHLAPKDGENKLRVTESSLIDAGILPPLASPEADVRSDLSVRGNPPDLSELVALIREQSERIASLEEQRFQLGAQLGAALVRIASLEERIEALPPRSLLQEVTASIESSGNATLPLPVLTDQNAVPPDRRLRDLAWQFTDAGFQQSARLGAGLLRLRTRQRIFGRTASSSPAD
jgi:hypothetical protein